MSVKLQMLSVTNTENNPDKQKDKQISQTKKSSHGTGDYNNL